MLYDEKRSPSERNQQKPGLHAMDVIPHADGNIGEDPRCKPACQIQQQAAARCESTFLEDSMVIGTSAMIETELDCIVNQYTDKFCNPMVMWGKYRKGWLKTTLPVSFQFHHVQMDVGHGALFLNSLQKTISQGI